MMQRNEGVLAVPDPDLETGGGGALIQTLRQGGGEGRSPKKNFSAPSGLSLV